VTGYESEIATLNKHGQVQLREWKTCQNGGNSQ
jgi:hypothetical protein